MRVRFARPEHPIAYGYGETTSVFRENQPVYGVQRSQRGRVVMQWGTKPRSDDDEAEPAGPAVLDIPTGKGRIVAFDFDPIDHYQTVSDFRLVWNLILNWNDLPPVPKGD